MYIIRAQVQINNYCEFMVHHTEINRQCHHSSHSQIMKCTHINTVVFVGVDHFWSGVDVDSSINIPR